MADPGGQWFRDHESGDSFRYVRDIHGQQHLVWYSQTQQHTQTGVQQAGIAADPYNAGYPPYGHAYQTPAYPQPQYPQPQTNQLQSYGGYWQHTGQPVINHHRSDSGWSGRHGSTHGGQAALTIPRNRRPRPSERIKGTPERGTEERLDPSYRMREGREAHQFFRRGRVFSMLWAEAASATDARQYLPNGTVGSFSGPGYTEGRFGESVYSNIRRFVIVKVRKNDNFVYACPISTYTGRGTGKPGCRPSEHAIVYFSGTNPSLVNAEPKPRGGMTKDPIEVVPSNPYDTMDPASRIRFGKKIAIEWNVKVKDIGMVVPHHMPKLMEYWKEEDEKEESDDAIEGEIPGTSEI